MRVHSRGKIKPCSHFIHARKCQAIRCKPGRQDSASYYSNDRTHQPHHRRFQQDQPAQSPGFQAERHDNAEFARALKYRHRAASFIEVPKLCFCAVVKQEGLAGIFIGAPEDAWSQAADLSAELHIRRVDKLHRQVLSVMPALYDDIWTAAKGMYKLEPVVADGGEVIIYAPHITELSYTHGHVIDEIGYHVRDYFVKQWNRFKDYSWGVLAHSTHLRGIGSYDSGVERPRIQVTLATGIPPDRCERVNLSYCDPGTIDPEEWAGRENEGVLLVPHAGELLYRVKQ